MSSSESPQATSPSPASQRRIATIVGVVIGGGTILIFLGALISWCMGRRKKRLVAHQQTYNAGATATTYSQIPFRTQAQTPIVPSIRQPSPVYMVTSLRDVYPPLPPPTMRTASDALASSSSLGRLSVDDQRANAIASQLSLIADMDRRNGRHEV